MSEILSDFFEGKEDEFIQALEDIAKATCPGYKLTYYGTKEALEKFKDVIPPEMEVHEIPSVVSKVPNEDMFLVVPVKDEKPLKFVWEKN